MAYGQDETNHAQAKQTRAHLGHRAVIDLGDKQKRGKSASVRK